MNSAVYPALCFGKLPAFGDFVRYNASGREILSFDQWLQQGLVGAKSRLGSNWEDIYDNTPDYHFLYYSENARQFLLGVFRLSHDKSYRRYPFLISLQIDLTQFDSRFKTYAPVIFNLFLDNARRHIADDLPDLDMNEISERIERLSAPFVQNYFQSIQGYREFLANTPAEQFFSKHFGSFEDDKKFLLMHNLSNILLPLRNRDVSRISLGFRFPLNLREDHGIYDVCFWQDLTLQLLGYPPAVLPLLFWPAGYAPIPSHLFLFLRPPSFKHFVNLLNPELDSDMVCKLEVDGKDNIQQIKNDLSTDFVTLLQNRQISLGDFLERLW